MARMPAVLNTPMDTYIEAGSGCGSPVARPASFRTDNRFAYLHTDYGQG